MRFRLLVLLPGIILPCWAQSVQRPTLEVFDSYARQTEAVLGQRWDGKLPFLSLQEHPADQTAVLNGQLWIQPGSTSNPLSVYDGLVHDWVGAVFIPNMKVSKVVEIMQNFDRHSQIYPEVKRSQLISRQGGDIKGYWRLERKESVVTAVLDVTQEAHWREIAPGKWICRAYAKDVSEVQDPGTPEEKVLPVGQGRGFLWRLYAYWSVEPKNGGVLAECRTLSLSRDVPAVLSWMVKPFVQSFPRDSLASTLEHTREAAEK